DLEAIDKESQKRIVAGRINPQDQDERWRLARRWSKPLNREAEEIEQRINQQWCQELDRLHEQRNGDEVEPQEKRTQASMLLELAEAPESFHAPDSVAYATVLLGDDGQRRETLPVRGQIFRSWLAQRYYELTGKATGSQTVHDVVGVLEARARFDGPAIPV